MKYIKFGFGAIAAQTINANCCCKNDNNNNDKKQTEEEIAIDEIVKYFGVQKDYILYTYTCKASEVNTQKYDEDIAKKDKETDERCNNLCNNNAKLESFPIVKYICNSDKAITIDLLSETFKINNNEIEDSTDAALSSAIKNKENKVFYTMIKNSGKTEYYIKK